MPFIFVEYFGNMVLLHYLRMIKKYNYIIVLTFRRHFQKKKKNFFAHI